MKTQKELLTAHRLLLDEKYKIKYPNGKFVLQIFHGVALHWRPKRNTGATSFAGISTRLREIRPGCSLPEIEQEKSQNSSFGLCYNYDSLDKLIIGNGYLKA